MTHYCPKCRGLLVASEFTDDNYGGRCWMARCVQCGNAFDEQTILNKLSPPSVREKYVKVREVGIRL